MNPRLAKKSGLRAILSKFFTQHSSHFSRGAGGSSVNERPFKKSWSQSRMSRTGPVSDCCFSCWMDLSKDICLCRPCMPRIEASSQARVSSWGASAPSSSRLSLEISSQDTKIGLLPRCACCSCVRKHCCSHFSITGLGSSERTKTFRYIRRGFRIFSGNLSPQPFFRVPIALSSQPFLGPPGLSASAGLPCQGLLWKPAASPSPSGPMFLALLSAGGYGDLQPSSHVLPGGFWASPVDVDEGCQQPGCV